MKIHHLIIICCIILSACNGTEQRPELTFREHGQLNYSHKDEQVLSFTDINNPIQGYSSEDQESLDIIFAEMIMSALDAGSHEFTDLEGNVITSDQAKAALKQTSFEAEPGDGQEDATHRSVERTVTAKDIVQVVTKENWYINEGNFSIQKIITHIAPVVYTFDTDGDVRGKKILFWVKLN
jgi:hypothetical protein